jgi:hypothetical protein
MEILETTKTVIDGKVVIELPHTLDNQDVKIIVSKDTRDEEDWANLPAAKRIEILKTFYGGDKFPNVKVGKYDVYNQ